MSPRTTRTTRLLPLATVAVATLIGLSACGSSSTASEQSATGTLPGSQSTSQGQGQFAGHGPFPGASGRVAEVDGTTLQVQGQSSQVAVTYTGATRITAQVKAGKADVKVGSCVMVMPVRTGSGTPGVGSPSTAPTGPIAAGEVRITVATGGSCTGGVGGGFGGHFRSGERPSGAPSGVPNRGGSYGGDSGSGPLPSGAPGRGRGFGGFGAFGKVTAVSGHGFTVASTTFDRASGASPRPTTQSVQITVSSATTYTTTRKATGAALKVGVCVTATGKADDTGAVSATMIQVSQPTDGSCTGGYGVGRG